MRIGDDKVRYVRRSTGWFGMFKTTSKSGEALVVEYATTDDERTFFKMIVSRVAHVHSLILKDACLPEEWSSELPVSRNQMGVR